MKDIEKKGICFQNAHVILTVSGVDYALTVIKSALDRAATCQTEKKAGQVIYVTLGKVVVYT
jgi:hypothetical protein